MNTSIYIAKRYLFSVKKMHAINIISGISMLGVFIGSAALVIILSVFNGLEGVILSLYNNFTPQLVIEPVKGKTFADNIAPFNKIKSDPAIFSYVEVLQERALLRYRNHQVIATMKGVGDGFLKNPRLDSIVLNGSFDLMSKNKEPLAVVGATVQGSLGINVNDPFSALQVYAPSRKAPLNSINPADEFVVRNITPIGIFSVQQDFDDMVIVPLSFMRDLLADSIEVSSVELNYKKGTNINKVQAEIQQQLGDGTYTVKNRYEQNTLLYKILHSEKWAVFIILSFVLVIAIFNIIGSLTMLVIDKKKDIAILSSLGAGKQLIKGIFFFEGMFISLVGCAGGIIAGLIFGLLQQHYGFIKMGGGLTVINAYPVAFKWTDFVLVLFTVTGIAVIASAISARLSVKGLDDFKQNL
ncbi:FtsX-like permease family protein [Mucilaginibacter ginkgonis]|uniref:ABC transporter permease n=1 Tax=Mucilaginibacter ginkgonis TaxID=2682091 RepID=A0A6I4INQ7_9SPHI|nr:FtsX-like permease family protein [Mucilaginibacter ginkgonis]QQL49022.1 ABC transporter permease [Mucilaginibacter ginkgonis]